LKRFLILLLSCMLLVPSFGSFFVYTTFKLNQEEISKTICVQRKMLFNDCNGRCELQKSLKKYEDNEKRMQNNLKEKTEIVYIQNLGITPFELLLPIETEAKLYASLNEKPVSISKTVFHPPSCLL
jgi:thioredoxin-related protein